MIARTWVVTAGDLTDMCTQFISFVDTTVPSFVDVPVDLTVDCLEDVPAPGECIATDECDDDVFTELFTLHSGAVVDSCVLTTAVGAGDDWSLWLPALEDLGLAPTDDWLFEDGAYLMTYEDGTAEIHGVIVNDEDDNLSFEVIMYFENGMDWTSWSALGRSYKDDAGLATPEMLVAHC